MGRRTQVEPTGERAVFAEAFRELVDATGLSLDRLAERVGRSATTLSRYQTGRGLPEESVLLAVHRAAADAAPMPADDLCRALAAARAGGSAPAPSPKRRSRRGLLGYLATACVAAVAALIASTVGHGEPPRPPSVHLQVCATDLLVRSAPAKPADGARRLGVLTRSDGFDVRRRSPGGTYAYGYARGEVRRTGWVDAQWLCDR